VTGTTLKFHNLNYRLARTERGCRCPQRVRTRKYTPRFTTAARLSHSLGRWDEMHLPFLVETARVMMVGLVFGRLEHKLTSLYMRMAKLGIVNQEFRFRTG
jgi:hypothetical protein